MNKYSTGVERWKEVPRLPGYEVSDRGVVRTYWRVVKTHYIKNKKTGRPGMVYQIERNSKPQNLEWHTDHDRKRVYVSVFMVFDSNEGKIIKRKLKPYGLNSMIAAAFGKKRPNKNHRLIHKNSVFMDFREKNIVWKRKTKRQGGNGTEKNTAFEARLIRWLIYKGLYPKYIAEKFGISIPLVSQIKNGKRWPHAGGPIKLNEYVKSEEQDRRCSIELTQEKQKDIYEQMVAYQDEREEDRRSSKLVRQVRKKYYGDVPTMQQVSGLVAQPGFDDIPPELGGDPVESTNQVQIEEDF